MYQFFVSIMSSILLLGLALSPLQAAPEEGKTFNDWEIGCDKKPDSEEKICHLQQLISEKESNKPILMVAAGYLPGREAPTIIITLPLGVLLPPGLTLQVDDNDAIAFPFEVCDPVGCRAGVELKDDLLKQFKSGKKAQLTFASIQRKPVGLPISLTGFTAGLKSLK